MDYFILISNIVFKFENNIFCMGFGERLKELRRSNRLTQQEMCERLYMEQSCYSKYETNRTAPSADILSKLVVEFNVSADWLLQQDSIVNNNSLITQQGNYYVVPKDVLDTLVKQQQLLESLLKKLLEKL